MAERGSVDQTKGLKDKMPGPPPKENLRNHTDRALDGTSNGARLRRPALIISWSGPTMEVLWTQIRQEGIRERRTKKTPLTRQGRNKHRINHSLLSRGGIDSSDSVHLGCLVKSEHVGWAQNGSQKLLAVRTGESLPKKRTPQAQPDNSSEGPYEEIPLQ